MCANKLLRRSRAQRGFSLVEVMVGMVVALLIGLAASGSARVFTASQRQGMGAGGMAVNGATAIAALKSDVASAGLGFFGDSTFRCYQLDLSVGAAVKFNAATFSPLLITSAGASDQLDVLYSTSIDGGSNVLLKGTSDGTSASLMSLLPNADVGQAVLLAPATPGIPCAVRSITANTAATDTTPQVLTFGGAGTYNAASFSTPPAFADRDRVALLGTLHWSQYSVVGTDLKITRPLTGDTATLMHNVMAFRVQYGVSANSASTTLTGWQSATAAPYISISGGTVDTVRAVRIGLVTRSAQREKQNSAGVCEASSTKPTDPLDPTVTVEPDVTDWQCYRYRSVVMIVPLRNLVW